MRRFEDIMVFSIGRGKYNPIQLPGKPYKWNSKRSKGEASSIKYKEDRRIDNSGTRFPTNVFEFPQERGLHPTQKPVSLISHIIKLYSNEGDLVLDTFSGSGTTAIAAIKNNRKYICIEKDIDIYKISSERIGSCESKTSGI